MKTKTKLLTIAPILLLLGCGTEQNDLNGNMITTQSSPQDFNSFDNTKTKNNRAFSYIDQSQIRADGISYINNLRQSAGMIAFMENDQLNTSAYNHAHYLIQNNITGHGEDSLNSNFTGTSPANRAIFAGYTHKYVSENLSTGNLNVIDSIDNLFSAIYHRFNFLDFSFDEIGLGAESGLANANNKAFNYDLGLSQLNNLCSSSPFNYYGSYYQNVCADSSFKIEASQYEDALVTNQDDNPAYVLWPYNNQNNAETVFFEEYPDPLPDCSVSGYPISVQFNPSKTGEIDIIDFKLYNNDKEITNTKVLDEKRDPNGRFSSNEAALFPLDRLLWNTNYKADVTYTEDGISKNITWSFKTKSLPYPHFNITNQTTKLDVKSGQTYLLYIAPQNCNDSSAAFSMSYSSNLSINSSFYDNNTIQLNINSGSGTIHLYTYNGRTITLNIN